MGSQDIEQGAAEKELFSHAVHKRHVSTNPAGPASALMRTL